MIRDRLVRACIGLLFLGLIVTGAGIFRPFDQTSARAAAAAPSAAAALEALPESFDIDISDLVVTLRGKPQKEVEDQLRDWAVYGTLIELGVDKDELGKATFKTAPVRLPYLQQAFLFDYGRGRRALLGDREAVLFYDADDPDPIATLGRVADRVRMETGEIPGRFQVLKVAPDLATNTIHITHRPPVAGSTLFGSKYGYVERRATSLDELTDWLAQIDDVTYAGVKEGALYLGGRRSAKSRTRNVTIDDIAALLQAHNQLNLERERLEVQRELINTTFQAEMKSRSSGWRGSSASEAETRARYEKKAAALQIGPAAPGFSLDPQWNPEGLAETLEKAAENPCGFGKEVFDTLVGAKDVESDASPLALRSSADLNAEYAALSSSGKKNVQAVCSAAREAIGPRLRSMAISVRGAQRESDPGLRAHQLDDSMLPLWSARRDLQSRGPGDHISLSLSLLNYLHAHHQIQCARYDGPLAGTNVGMNLFYTDLLAKLWKSVDFHHASPGMHVPGFLSSPRMRLEDEWQAETSRLPSTRIWFGPRSDGYARSKGGDSVWFEHIATRVFAAGSDPAQPDKEEQPAEGNRRALTWWDRHYEAVADYEQQYHVQNQIQKWSLITGWWRDKLQYLKAVSVDHDQRFDRWYDREKSGLRYQFPIPLRPESEWVTHTECIDLLSSYPFVSFDSGIISQMSGGVSLGSRAAVEHAPEILADKPWALRQVTHDAPGGPGRSAEIQPLYKGPGEVAVELTKTTPTRVGGVDAGLSKINVRYARAEDAEATIAIGSDKGAIGSLVGRREAGGVGLHWSPGGVHTGLIEPAAPSRPIIAPDLPAQRALSALQEGDTRAALEHLAGATPDDPARLRRGIDELRALALGDAEARFAAGDSESAKRLYGAAETLGKLPPKARMLQALAEIERGQTDRALTRLAALPGLDQDALLTATEGRPGLAELHGLTEAQSQHAPSLFGRTANDVGVASEGADLRTVLRIDPGQLLLALPLAKRVEMLRAHGENLVIYVDGFSFNGADFEASAPGTLTDLARSPSVAWTAVEDAGGAYKPSILLDDGKRIERMPMRDEAGSTASTRAARITGASRVVFIHNCDVDNDGAISAAERAACNAG